MALTLASIIPFTENRALLYQYFIDYKNGRESTLHFNWIYVCCQGNYPERMDRPHI